MLVAIASDLGDRNAERGPQRRHGRGRVRLRRHGVLQAAEVPGGLEADDVRPRREGLADLAEHGAQAPELRAQRRA